MDLNIEKECSALGGLFQQIMNDMKQSTPVWEDFLTKSSKLHNTLRATLLATTAWLDAFQKLADLATASRGATREIGSALTRLCMRHRSIEGKLKAFSSCLLDVLVVPMQDRMEEWKKSLVILDKDHAKGCITRDIDYKKARADIKKASSDTIRLQKKVKKGKSDVQGRLDSALQEVNDKYQILQETEKNAVRNALIEERSRFCLYISCLKPVVDEEISMLTEVTHLQEILQHLCLQASDPSSLPTASEQVIRDLKVTGGAGWTYQTPPSSPSSLGSRKSSMCSISSINSSSSGGTNMSSPGHNFRNRNSSQSLPPGMVRLSSVSSQDSGFTSQEAVFMRPPSPGTLAIPKSSLTDSTSSNSTDSAATTPSPSYPSSSVSTWSNWPDPPSASYSSTSQQEAGVERPHTISSAYEKSHNRPALSNQLFEPPEPGLLLSKVPQQQQQQQQMQITEQKPQSSSHYAVPCINTKTASVKGKEKNYDTVDYKPPIPGPKPRGKPVAPPMVPDFGSSKLQQLDASGKLIQHPVYVNQDDLAKMAAEMDKGQGRHEDIPEEDEEEEVTTPTAQYHGDTISSSQHHGEGKAQPGVSSVPSQDGSLTPTDDLDIATLSHIIDDLSASTAALQGLGEEDKMADKVKVNGSTEDLDKTANELTAAIKELEASTAALEIYNDNTMATNNRNSMQCSSGYGTMNSTPTISEDTIASDLDETLTNIDAELDALTRDGYNTLPRRTQVARSQSMRTHSPIGRGLKREGGGTQQSIRRSSSSLSNGPKPPPPVRRNSSISSSTAPPSGGKPSSAPGSSQHTPQTQSPPSAGHRRSHSESEGGSEPPPTALKPDKNPRHQLEESSAIRGGYLVNQEDDMDLPPPPPPEELERDIINATRNSIVTSPSSSAGQVNGDRSSVLEKAKMFNSVGVGQVTAEAANQRQYATPAGMSASMDSKHYYAIPGRASNSTSSNIPSEGEPQKHYASVKSSAVTRGHSTEMHYAASDLVMSEDGESSPGRKPVQRQGSVVNSHASIITTLTQQFASRPSLVKPGSPSSPQSMDSDNDITPTAESPPPGEPLLTEVKSGIVLRKAYSSDRSEPRVS